MSDNLPILSLTQGQLTLLETCPRKFQYVYLEGLRAPVSLEQQERALWGSQFHLLMQQQALELPIQVMAEADAEMLACVNALQQAAPELFTPRPGTLRQSEHQRTLAFQGYLLTVVYDLLLLSPDRGQILDWKTYPQPPNQLTLERNWQTRLYLYVLTETSDLTPEQVSLTYWFVRSPDPTCQPPTCHLVRYSRQRHQQTHQALLHLTSQLDQLRAQAQPFPKADIGHCQFCDFALRCDRPQRIQDGDLARALALDCETVAEMPL
jgi:hypothetical protein